MIELIFAAVILVGIAIIFSSDDDDSGFKLT